MVAFLLQDADILAIRLVFQHEVGIALVLGDIVDEEALFVAVFVDKGQGLDFAVGLFDDASLVGRRQCSRVRIEIILQE